jgi:hypothetical protein
MSRCACAVAGLPYSMEAAFGIWMTNAYPTSNGAREGGDGQAVFEQICRLQHSCRWAVSSRAASARSCSGGSHVAGTLAAVGGTCLSPWWSRGLLCATIVRLTLAQFPDRRRTSAGPTPCSRGMRSSACRRRTRRRTSRRAMSSPSRTGGTSAQARCSRNVGGRRKSGSASLAHASLAPSLARRSGRATKGRGRSAFSPG